MDELKVPWFQVLDCVLNLYSLRQVPHECQRYKDHRPGYTCLGDCKLRMPLHCDRFVVATLLHLSQFPADSSCPVRPPSRIAWLWLDMAQMSRLAFIQQLCTNTIALHRHEWDYWRMKNSWGTMWGEGGYVRLFRGIGHCGVGSYVSQAICTA